ncbi:DUF2000 family protein [Bounagaea algeriensis]
MTDPQVLRTAIAVPKSLEAGAVANAAAIVMGQLSLLAEDLYEPDGVPGPGGIRHAGIRNNVVILKGRQGQLDTLADAAALSGEVVHVAFTELGRRSSNSFAEYERALGEAAHEDLALVAVGIAGPDGAVRDMTKKLSSYSG